MTKYLFLICLIIFSNRSITSQSWKLIPEDRIHCLTSDDVGNIFVLETRNNEPYNSRKIIQYNYQGDSLTSFDVVENPDVEIVYYYIAHLKDDNLYIVGYYRNSSTDSLFLSVKTYDKSFDVLNDTLIPLSNSPIPPIVIVHPNERRDQLHIIVQTNFENTFYIFRTHDFTYRAFDLKTGALVTYMMEQSENKYIGNVSEGYILLNPLNNMVDIFDYSTKQGLAYSSNTSLRPIDPNHFLYFTSVGLLKGIHKNLDKFPVPSNLEQDTYSGVVYKVQKDYPYKIEKYLRIGDRREFLTTINPLEIVDSNNIYLGAFNYGALGITDWSRFHRRYFRIANITADLTLNWDQTFYPTTGHNFINLSGIESLPDGNCLVFGLQYDFSGDYEFDSFILLLDKNGNILPFDGNQTGIKNENTDWISIKTYPNPVTDYLFVDIQNTSANFSLEFYDEIGRTVISKKVQGNENHAIDFTKLPKGVYFYKLTDGKNILKTGTIVH